MIPEIITQISDYIKLNAPFLEQTSYSPVKYFERYYGQYLPDVEGKMICPMPLPAILFEFEFDFLEENAMSQGGTGILRVHIVQENYAWAATVSSDFDVAMRTFKHVEQIHVLLQGFSGDNFGKLQRRRYYPDKNNSITIVDILEYAFVVKDDSTNLYRDYESNGGDATVKIEKQLVQKIPPVERVSKYVV